MTNFQYSQDLLTRYPNLHGGVILASGMTNAPSPTALQDRYTAEQQAVKAQIGNTPLSEIPSLSAWRDTFRRFGVEPTKYRSAPESLLRRLTKKGDIPFINTLVDIGNLVSIRYALPVAVFDTGTIQDAITVRFADGTERYLPLGEAAIEHPEVGEVVFVDEGNNVHARRWCWRQSDQSAAQLDTTNAIITVEAQHADGDKDVRAAVQDLVALLKEFAGGTFTSDVLSADHPVI